MQSGFTIDIDGPAASGKGTVVQLLTKDFSGVNVYTGGMYRALVLQCQREQVRLDDKEKILQVLGSASITLGDEDRLNEIATIYLNGQDVTQLIKTPEIGIGAGKLVKIDEVRYEMVKRQKDIVDKFIGKGKVVVLDGQDTALIYKEAPLKIFLTASQDIRAKRRQKQYEKQGIQKSFKDVLEEIRTRDNQDWSRHLHPLSKDPESDGYFLLDSTNLDERQTVEAIENELKRRNLINDSL